MTFVREIPKDKITPTQIEDLKATGFVLIDKEESVEVWADGMAVI
jgi:hypothetical protein